MRKWSKFFLLIVLLSSMLVSTTAHAVVRCNTYHTLLETCTICDFYGPNEEYQGYIEWCVPNSL